MNDEDLKRLTRKERRAAGPACYGYGRGSTHEQEETLIAQEAAIRREYAYRYEPAGLRWGGMFTDRGVSGGTPLRDRPEGLRLSGVLERGDTVVFAKLDRGFRSLEDLAQTLRVWRKRGVRMALLDIQLDTGSPVGEMVVGILGAVAQFERRRIGERTSEALQSRKGRGRKYGVNAPYPFRAEGKQLVPDLQRKANAELIVSMFNAGYNQKEIAAHLNSHQLRTSKGEEWSWVTVDQEKNRERDFQACKDPVLVRLWLQMTQTKKQVESE